MRRIVVLRVLLVVVAVAAACFGSARAQNAGSNDVPNSVQACSGGDCRTRPGTDMDCDPTPGVCVASHNMPDLGSNTVVRRLTSAVKFRKGNVYYYFTPITNIGAGCADEIRECSCDTGEDIAARGMNQYAKKALNDLAPCIGTYTDGLGNPLYRVVKNGGAGACPANPAVAAACTCTSSANSASCTNTLAADAVTLKIQRLDENCGFILTKAAFAEGFTIDDDPPCNFVSTVAQSTHSNIAGIDMPSQYLLQVDPNGVNGIVNVSAKLTQGSPPVSCAPFDTTGQSPSQIHNFLKTCLDGLLGVNSAVVDSDPGNSENNKGHGHTDPGQENARAISEIPGLRFASGPLVRVRSANAKAYRITVQGQPGMLIRQEGSVPSPNVPALSEWGMIVVALLLLTSGYWLFRRQRKQIRS
jgi:hypothetical protein